MSEKDENSPHRIASRRRDSLNHPQRSSASPTSNIWLRLIEDEENIGNVIFQHLNFTSGFDLPIPHRTTTIHPHFRCPAYPSPNIHIKAPNAKSQPYPQFPVYKIPYMKHEP